MTIQAIHISGMEKHPIEEMKKLKFSITWLILILFGSILFSVITGAIQMRASIKGYTHLGSVGICLTLHAFIYMREYSMIVNNSRIVSQVLSSYETWRESKDAHPADAGDAHQTI